jgi:hypothetical protein
MAFCLDIPNQSCHKTNRKDVSNYSISLFVKEVLFISWLLHGHLDIEVSPIFFVIL